MSVSRKGRDTTPRLRLRSVHAGADPSADELRQKLHERIEVLTLLSFHIIPMLAIAGIEAFHHMLGSSSFSGTVVSCAPRKPLSHWAVSCDLKTRQDLIDGCSS